jgi:hypothetical protein
MAAHAVWTPTPLTASATALRNAVKFVCYETSASPNLFPNKIGLLFGITAG